MLVFGYSIVSSSGWPDSTRIFIWVVSLPGFLISLIELLKILSAKRKKSKDGMMDVGKKELTSYAWMSGFIAAIWLLGLEIALPLYSFLYLKIEGGRPLWVCFVFAATAYVLIFVFAAKIIGSFWPAGVLWNLIGV